MEMESELKMSRLLKLAQTFNCFYLTGFHSKECRPFIVDGHQVGLIRPNVLKQILRYPNIFLVCYTDKDCQGVIELNPAFRDYTERSKSIANVLHEFRNDGLFVTLKGWRDECYDVKTNNGVSLLKMDRSATCLFGIRNYGVDINGYVRHPTKGLCLWLQQRSDTKQTWPGKWDNMVSGGWSVGYGIKETAVKEAAEEASITESLIKNLVSAGCVSFYFESERGLFPNTEFVFDLELPVDFVPSNSDGEVQAFELLSAEDCIEKIMSPDFKTTSCPVVLDFLIRHGVITPENEKNFTQIVELLHVPLQTLYKYQVTKMDIYNKLGNGEVYKNNVKNNLLNNDSTNLNN